MAPNLVQAVLFVGVSVAVAAVAVVVGAAGPDHLLKLLIAVPTPVLALCALLFLAAVVPAFFVLYLRWTTHATVESITDASTVREVTKKLRAASDSPVVVCRVAIWLATRLVRERSEVLQQLAGSRAGGGGAEVQPPSAQALLTPSLKQAKACGTAEALMEALETHLQDVAVVRWTASALHSMAIADTAVREQFVDMNGFALLHAAATTHREDVDAVANVTQLVGDLLEGCDLTQHSVVAKRCVGAVVRGMKTFKDHQMVQVKALLVLLRAIVGAETTDKDVAADVRHCALVKNNCLKYVSAAVAQFPSSSEVSGLACLIAATSVSPSHPSVVQKKGPPSVSDVGAAAAGPGAGATTAVPARHGDDDDCDDDDCDAARQPSQSRAVDLWPELVDTKLLPRLTHALDRNQHHPQLRAFVPMLLQGSMARRDLVTSDRVQVMC